MKLAIGSVLRGGTALGLLLAILAAPARGVVVIDPVTPSTLYATLNDEELYKSTDAGATWTELKAGGDSAPLGHLFIDPHTPTTLYGITTWESKNVPLKSNDGGQSWTLLLQGQEEVRASTVAIDPQTPTTLYVGVNGGGLKSRDGGHTWSSLWASLPEPQTEKAPAPDSLGGYSVTPFKDKIASASSHNTIFALAIHPQVPMTLYAGTAHGIWKSTDGGQTWTEKNAGLHGPASDTAPFDATVLHLVLAPLTPATLYANTGKLVKSTDGGESWSILKGRWPANYGIHALAIDPKTSTTLYVAIAMVGFFKSTDGGQHWTAINKGLPLDFEKGDDASLTITDIAVDPQTPTTLYVVASSNGGEGIFKSLNGGHSWAFSHLGYAGLARLGEGKKRTH